MGAVLETLRELNLISILVRLFLAMLLGGLVGLERGRKHRAAGFRTYMLVCIGAALTMLLGQYQDLMLATRWASMISDVGNRSDITRYGAQVISGIGFLGAGTIVLTGRKEVKGLTTAAGLWACACMGLAIGAGFYECVILGLALIFLCIRVLPLLEIRMRKRSRNMNLYIEFSQIQEIRAVTACLRQMGVTVVDVEIEPGQKEFQEYSNAVLNLKLKNKQSHSEILSAVSQLDHLHKIDEM